MLTALWSAGEHFPNANIRCGMGIDWAGGFQKRRDKEYMGYLELIFQDFADFTDSGDKNKARAIFTQAERYAKEHNVQLQAGWYKRKERYGL
jgi:hypothetical protein